MRINSIGFKGTRVGVVEIDKIDSVLSVSKKDVNFVELNPQDKNDVDALMSLIHPWGGLDSYTLDITKDIHDIYTGYKAPYNNQRFFVLTQQENDFEKLNPEDILSAAEITYPKEDVIKINYLETNPKYRKDNLARELAHIGTKFVDMFKTLAGTKTLTLLAEKERIGFYKKLGFKKLFSNNKLSTTMVYRKKII